LRLRIDAVAADANRFLAFFDLDFIDIRFFEQFDQFFNFAYIHRLSLTGQWTLRK